MAVPGAVTRRAERDAEELRQQGIDPTSGAPIGVQSSAPAAPAAPTLVPSTPPVDDAAALRARIAELEQAESTQSGRASAASRELEELKKRTDLVDGNRSFLEGELVKLKERLDATEAENATLKRDSTVTNVDKAIASLDGAGPTEAQLKEFGDEGVDFVVRVAKQQMSAVMAPLVERLRMIEQSLGRLKELDKLPKLEEVGKVMSMETQRNKELEFIRTEILPSFSDFEKVRTTKEWQDYLGQDIPGRGIKVGHLLNSYRQLSDADGIRSLLTAFYNKRASKPTLDSLVVPDKTNADVAPKPAEAKIKASEYKQKLRDFIAKKLPKPEWETFRARWDHAVATGAVEMDTEIR